MEPQSNIHVRHASPASPNQVQLSATYPYQHTLYIEDFTLLLTLGACVREVTYSSYFVCVCVCVCVCVMNLSFAHKTLYYKVNIPDFLGFWFTVKWSVSRDTASYKLLMYMYKTVILCTWLNRATVAHGCIVGGGVTYIHWACLLTLYGVHSMSWANSVQW